MELKPKKTSFLIGRLVPRLTTLAILTAIAATAAGLLHSGQLALAVVTAGLLIVAGVVWVTLVAYAKERYLFGDHHIVRKAGGPLSDRHTELKVRNITHVQVVLPWLRYRFFNVGHVLIDSAGSGEAMRLEALREPEQVVEQVRRLMQHNGFALRQQHRLHEEQPATVGVALEVGGTTLGALLFLAFGPPAIGAFLQGLPAPWDMIAAVLAGLAIPAGFVAFVALRWLDLKRRTYTVFNDTVVYTEGFLTRNNAFIPAENIADADSRQTLIEQILGLYNVTISCQGSGQEVRFRHLRHGPQLNAAVDSIARTASPVPVSDEPTPPREPATLTAAAEPAPSAAAEPAAPLSRTQTQLVDETITGTFYVHKLRAFAPHLLAAAGIASAAVIVTIVLRRMDMPFRAVLGGGGGIMILLGLAWINAVVRAVLVAYCTRFEMRPRSVKRIYRFTSTQETEFSSDKLTGLAWVQGPLDRLFGTCTVRFWSIGSEQTLDFVHVARCTPADLLDRSLGKAGIRSNEIIYQMRSHWSPGAMLAASLPGLALTAAATIGLLIAAAFVSSWLLLGIAALAAIWLILAVYLPVYYRRCQAIFHDRHVELHRGVFIRSREHALYDNVKHITTVRYPGTDRGRIGFSIAGQGPFAGFVIRFADAIATRNDLIDAILQQRPTASALPRIESALHTPRERPVRLSRPHPGNTLVPLILTSVIVFPLIALLPLTLPWAVLAVRRRHYVIEPGRVLAFWGVMYQRRRSVIFDKIDHIRQSQGPLNKLFANGDVLIYTAGSSSLDMNARHIGDYRAFYNDLRARYTGDETPA